MKLLGQIKNAENEYDFSHLLYYGDYACVNFLALYPQKCQVLKNTEYPEELKEEFGISDGRLFHRKMIADGYLEPSSIAERLSSDSLEDIVKIAEEIGIPSVGTKEEVLQRLTLNCTLEQLEKYLPEEDVYSLSEAGKKYMESKQDLLDLYQKRDQYHVSYNEYICVKSKNPELSFQDALWQVMTTRFNTHAENMEYSLVQDEYLNMYALLKDQARNGEALNALLTYFFMDLNVFDATYQYIEEFKRSSVTVPEFLSKEPLPQFTMKKELLDQIAAMKESYQPKAAESISQNNVSYYANTEMFLKILQQIFDGTLSIEETEQEINARIPKALDHILRAEQK